MAGLGIAVFLMLWSLGWSKIGLMVRSADVVLEHLQLGGTYNLRQQKGFPYIVINAGDSPAEILVESVVPQPGELMTNYEPIPDPSWVKMIPERFRLNAGESRACEIVLDIPADEKYNNRHYQVHLWAHTLETGLLAAGMLNRLRFSIGGAGPETLMAEKKRKRMVSLELDMSPASIYVLGMRAGVRYDVKKENRTSIKIANKTDSVVKLKLASVQFPQDVQVALGYEKTPDPTWLTVKPEKIKVKANRVVETRVFLEIPGGESQRGKKYAFLVKAELENVEVPLELFTRVYVSIE